MQADERAIEELIAALRGAGGRKTPPPPSAPHGGGGGNWGLEARVAKLEADVAHLVKAVDRLTEVPTEIGILKARVDELPSKGFIVTATVGALTLVAAISGFVQWVVVHH